MTTQPKFEVGQAVVYVAPNGARVPARVLAVVHRQSRGVRYRIEVFWEPGCSSTILTTATQTVNLEAKV